MLFFQLRMGAPRHRLHARHVRPGGAAAGDDARGGVGARAVQQPHAPRHRQLPLGAGHGCALCGYEVIYEVTWKVQSNHVFAFRGTVFFTCGPTKSEYFCLYKKRAFCPPFHFKIICNRDQH